MKKKLLSVALCCLAWSAIAVAAEVKVGGEVFFHYLYRLPTFASDYDPRVGDNDRNEFDITRARLTASAVPQEQWRIVLVTDVEREQDFQADVDEDGELESVDNPDAGRFELVLRYANMTWQPLPYLGLQGGIIETPWIVFVERAFGWRVADRMAAEWVGWNGEPTDLGLAALGDLPGGFGSYRVQIVNGEGANSLEVEKQKAGEARVVFIPAFGEGSWRNLSLSAAFRYHTSDNPPGRALYRDVVTMGLLQYRDRRLNLALEGSLDLHWVTDDNKYDNLGLEVGGWVTVRATEWLEPLLRLERYDPDLETTGLGIGNSLIDAHRLAADEDGLWRGLVGLGFLPVGGVQTALSGLVEFYDETYESGPRRGEHLAPAAELRFSLAFRL